MPELRFDIVYERTQGRCVWCWEVLPSADTHVVLRHGSAELRFHHQCWPTYRACSGIERAMPRPWTPARAEELRLRGGWNQQEFAGLLRVNPEQLRRFFSGADSALSDRLVERLDVLEADLSTRQGINWSDERAFFCLAMRCNWSAAEAASAVGVSVSTAKLWLQDGVTRLRPAAWAKLSRLAEKHRFDAGMIVDDRLWTPALLAAAVETAGKEMSQWVALTGMSRTMLWMYMRGTAAITRATAWKLTRAAAALDVELPPVGRVHAPRPKRTGGQAKQKPPGKPKWKPEAIALLGTDTDAAVAKRLGLRLATVAKMRSRLGIPAFVSTQKKQRL